MKKKVLLTAASLMLAVAVLRAQAPAKFNYQGVARSAAGAALPNQALGLRISILNGSSNGTVVYSETQTVTTNSFGLYNLAIGAGAAVTGSLGGVAWGNGDKYIKVEIDASGGSNYVDAGTAQLLSVPYALYAGGSLTATNGTANYLPKFASGASLSNSGIFETTTGRVGIGTTTPVGKLEIAGTDTVGLRVTTNSALGAPNGILQVEYTGTSTTTGSFGVFSECAPSTSVITGVGVGGVGGYMGLRGRGISNSNASDVYGSYSDAFSQGNTIGVLGAVNNATGTTAGIKVGLLGNASGGNTNYAVYGIIPAGTTGISYAGYFGGNVQIVGSLAKSAGTFKIDHPQDPANKYLYHSFVESPDMMNVYNGNATTDASGYATVTLPAYFEALNKDFRYQLTVMGQTFAQAIVSQKVQGNQFQIRTNQPNVEVSWQVTGIRNDAYAQAHRVVPEVPKEAENQGKYLNPAELGQPASLQIGTMPSAEAAQLAPIRAQQR